MCELNPATLVEENIKILRYYVNKVIRSLIRYNPRFFVTS